VRYAPSARPLSAVPDILHLRFTGGYYNQLPQRAMIRFMCDMKAQKPTGPEYWGGWKGVHWMNWRTRHACLSSINPHAPHPPHRGEHRPGTGDHELDTSRPDARTRNIWTRASWIGVTYVLVPPRARPGADAAAAVRSSSS
jgi:hypothetical protein